MGWCGAQSRQRTGYNEPVRCNSPGRRRCRVLPGRSLEEALVVLLLFVLRCVPVGHGKDAVRVVKRRSQSGGSPGQRAFGGRGVVDAVCESKGCWWKGGRMSWASVRPRVVGGEGKREGGREVVRVKERWLSRCDEWQVQVGERAAEQSRAEAEEERVERDQRARDRGARIR